MVDRDFYRVDELAVKLRVTVKTVRRWLKGGQVFYIDLPKGKLIPRDEYLFVLQHGPRRRPKGSTGL